MKPFLKYMVIAFLAGLLIGGVSGRYMSPWCFFTKPSPEKREERHLNRFSSKLDLTPQQKEEVKAILKSKREQMQILFSEGKPKFDAIRDGATNEIRKILTPEQQVKFEKMHKRFQDRRKKHHSPFPF